jgi:hypothetical protein
MQITGRDFGPVAARVEGGVIVEAARPISYMKNWSLERVIRLAERWHWRIRMSDEERAQLGDASPP